MLYFCTLKSLFFIFLYVQLSGQEQSWLQLRQLTLESEMFELLLEIHYHFYQFSVMVNHL